MLADCLTHAIEHGAERLVDVATLTGAIVTALGTTTPGCSAPTTTGARRSQPPAARGEPSGGCRCTGVRRRRSRAATPTSSTPSRTARRARSPRPSSCAASPATCRGRTWTSPAPPGTRQALRAEGRLRASACGCCVELAADLADAGICWLDHCRARGREGMASTDRREFLRRDRAVGGRADRVERPAAGDLRARRARGGSTGVAPNNGGYGPIGPVPDAFDGACGCTCPGVRVPQLHPDRDADERRGDHAGAP